MVWLGTVGVCCQGRVGEVAQAFPPEATTVIAGYSLVGICCVLYRQQPQACLGLEGLALELPGTGSVGAAGAPECIGVSRLLCFYPTG